MTYGHLHYQDIKHMTAIMKSEYLIEMGISHGQSLIAIAIPARDTWEHEKDNTFISFLKMQKTWGHVYD